MDLERTDRILLYLLCREPDEAVTSEIAHLSESHWGHIISRAAEQYVTPLLYHRLRTIFKGLAVPDETMRGLGAFYLYTAASNMRFHRELCRLLEQFRVAGIEAVVLKGAHLGASIYEDPGLRFMRDLDLLVRKEDITQIDEMLRHDGYIRSTKYPDHPFEALYLRSNDDFAVDIHWNLHSEAGGSVKVDTESLWRRAQSEMLRGKERLVLAPEDLLSYICLHEAGHDYLRLGLRAFCDIAHAIRHYHNRIRMDWNQVVLRARQWGITKSSYLTFYLAREWLSADVPDLVLKALRPKRFNPKVLSWAKQAIFSPLENASPVSENFAQLWAAKGHKSKLATFLRGLFPPQEVMSKIYSLPLDGLSIYLYYPWRPIDLALRYGPSAWRVAHRDKGVLMKVESENSKVFLREWLEA